MFQRQVGTPGWRENFEGKCQDDQMHEDMARLGCIHCGTKLEGEDCPSPKCRDGVNTCSNCGSHLDEGGECENHCDQGSY